MTVHPRSDRSTRSLGTRRRPYVRTPRQRDQRRLHEAIQLEVALRRLAQLR